MATNLWTHHSQWRPLDSPVQCVLPWEHGPTMLGSLLISGGESPGAGRLGGSEGRPRQTARAAAGFLLRIAVSQNRGGVSGRG